MRVRRLAPVLAVLLLAACEGGEPVPPAPADAPPGPPPAAPPPPLNPCREPPPGTPPDPGRPSDEECERINAQFERETAARMERERKLRESSWIRAESLPPFEERKDPNPDMGSWMQQLVPDETSACMFTERPRSQRPSGLIVQAWSGNMDLLADGEVLGHDHAIGFVEAWWMKNKPVIAARAGMPDLWIEPVGNHSNLVLRIGADELTCVRWEG